MGRLRTAIIGCGRISYKHVEAILHNREIMELVACCDVVGTCADSKMEQYTKGGGKQGSIYLDYKTMLEKEDIDLVTIATESGYHAEIALNCMNAGVHVIVEKPMALSTYDADAMISCSEKNKVILAVCHQNRFNQAIIRMREAVEAGRFGKIMTGTARILWSRNENYYLQAPWRGTWELDGGCLMNQCIHNIDLLQWMLGGEVESVFSMCDTYQRNIEGEDFGAVLIRFQNGCIGIVEGNIDVYPTNLEETLSVFGTQGTVCIGGLAVNRINTWRFADADDEEEERVIGGQDGDPDNVYGYGHSPLFADAVKAIRDGSLPLVNGYEGKKALSIILAAYKTRLTGQLTRFPLTGFSTLDMKRGLSK